MTQNKQNTETDYAIYALTDPRDSIVRYVGISNNGQRRFREHIQRAVTSSPKDVWIRELLDQELLPKFTILETTNNENTAREREVYWVDFYNKKHDLLNWNLNEQIRNGGTRIDIFVPDELTGRGGK